MKKVIIAEKPSVAKNIADALGIKSRQDGCFEGEEYIVTWAYGHLLSLYDAKDYDEKLKKWDLNNFPFIPEKFQYKVKPDPKNKDQADVGAKKQIKIIKELMNRKDVDGVISATDYDREGQVIADEIFLCFNPKKPIYRLLLNEWTQEEVKKGLRTLKSNDEMKPLQDAGMGRQWADWIIGINLTSVATVKYGKGNLLNLGRVVLPTLKIIYDRDEEIRNFKTSSYYKLLIQAQTEKNELFEATYYEPKSSLNDTDNSINEDESNELDKNSKETEKFEDIKTLEKVKELIEGKKVIVVEKEVSLKKEYAPPLFNLTNLQGYVTSKEKGWTSDEVLKVAQTLYENKFITYPRTNSAALDESLKEKTEKVLNAVKSGLPYENQIKFHTNKRVFDNSKVESHSAITPTYVKPNNLSAKEQVIYDAVKNRFLMQFLPIAEYEETKIVLKSENEEVIGTFIARGKVQLVEGWKIIEPGNGKDVMMPLVEKKELLNVIDPTINTVVRKPPAPHTEKTLLKVMETCGRSYKEEDGENSAEMMANILSGFSIGTPATRAETIKKLKDTGYVVQTGKKLVCTPLGKELIETLPIKELMDLEYTGKLEKTLSDIEKGKFSKKDFLDIIKAFTINSVENMKKDTNEIKNLTPTQQNEAKKSDAKSLGKCPLCGADIIENDKAFGCVGWQKGCKYTIWKNDKYFAALGKKITSSMVEKLLKEGKLEIDNLTSKKGNKYSGIFRYTKNANNDFFGWTMEFKK